MLCLVPILQEPVEKCDFKSGFAYFRGVLVEVAQGSLHYVQNRSLF